MNKEHVQDTAQIIGQKAAALALIEVSLGSFVHSFKIPFGGTLLSLNQGYFLCQLIKETKTHPSCRTLPFSVSVIVALLKSLSPAGNKLAPMVSISMQGFLFSLPLMLFGLSLPIVMLASSFASVWSFVQPILSYYVLFGPDFFLALEFVAKKTFPFLDLTKDKMMSILFTLMIVKATTAALLAIAASRKASETVILEGASENLFQKMTSKSAPTDSAFLLAIKDLFRPLFLISFVMTAVFLFYSESESATLIWKLMRPLALAFLFFYISRTFLILKLFSRLKNTRYEFLYNAYLKASHQLTVASKRAI